MSVLSGKEVISLSVIQILVLL